MAIRVFSDGHLLLETGTEDSLRYSKDFVGLLKQRICEVRGVPRHRQKLMWPGKSELAAGRSWESLGAPLEVSMEIQPEDRVAEFLDSCHHACEDRVRRFLRDGQNPNAHGKGHRRPLDLAIDSGHAGTVRALLEGKANLTADSLHVAAEKNHPEVVRTLLGARAKLEAVRKANTQWDGMTVLQQSCRHGFSQVVEVLLSARAKVDTQGPQGETALHLASNYDTAMSLFRAQANPDISDHQGAKAFYRCAENGYETVTRAFFDAGLLEDSEAAVSKLMRAVHALAPCSSLDRKLRFAVWDHGHSIDGLIQQRADPNQANIYGFTPLHLAASAQNVEGVRQLLKYDAHPDPVTLDEEAVTPMHIAAVCSFIDVVMHLVSASGDINKKSGIRDRTALHQASAMGHVEMVRNLIFSSAAVDCRDADGQSPLHHAVNGIGPRENQTETAQLLLIANAKVDRHDESGHTPFHLAASSGCTGLVKSLLMAFAPLDQRDATSEGDQALHLAVKAGHLHVVKMLVEAMVCVRAQNNSGNSPLHLASAYAHLELVRYLLRAGAPVNSPNFRGETPLHLAMQDGFVEVSHVLREAGGVAEYTTYLDHGACGAWMWPKNFQPVYAWPPTMPMPLAPGMPGVPGGAPFSAMPTMPMPMPMMPMHE